MGMRLHPASLPAEAEFRCGTAEPCALGLTRGFALGSDLFGTLATTLLGQHLYESGTWLFYDVFAAYQFLSMVDSKIYANGSVGYRGFSYENTNKDKVETAGLTFRLAYAQEITPVYSQGVTVEGFVTKPKFNRGAAVLYNLNEPADREPAVKALKEFYKFSQKYPRLRVGLPADLELINWKASHIDLPNHLRGYLHLEPFYITNDMKLSDRYEFEEKNYGLRVAMTTAYESAKEKAGRFAAKGSVGADLSASDTVDKCLGVGANSLACPTLKPSKRPVFGLYVNLEASYQF